ncbi:MAG: aspartate/glutamate racemase family protein [Roseobacter sp.]
MQIERPAKLGILMLDTRFPRIPGDIGNPATWDFPVDYAVVSGATPKSIIQQDPDLFIASFIGKGRKLVEAGCAGIATTCGFLSVFRRSLARELGVPVAASALEQARQICETLPEGRSLGVLTISEETLSAAHLDAASVPSDAIVVGVAETEFGQSILNNVPELDVEQARFAIVVAAKRMVAQAPQTGAILLECTNMVPYAHDIACATGLPVYSIYTYLTWFQQSLSPRRFPAP